MSRPTALLKRALSSKVLVLVLGIQGALIVLRSVNLYMTGFQTADEVNYIFDIMTGHPYGGRYFFNDQATLLFKAFSIDTIGRFVFFFPFYAIAWDFAFLILAYKTVSLLTKNNRARDLTMFSLPFAVSYSLLSVGFLTEGTGLTMCMLGIYAWTRYVKVERRWYLAVISSAAFVAAAYSREPYVIFPVMGAVAWIALSAARKAHPLHTAFFVLIAALVLAAPAGTFYGASGAITAVPTSVTTYTQVSSSATSTLTTTTISRTTVTGITSYVTTISGIETTLTTTTTSVVTNTVNTTATIVTATPQFNGFFSGWAQVASNSVILFFIGMFLGWGPVLFAASLAAFILAFKSRRLREIPWLQVFLALISLATFFGSVFVFFYEFHFYLTQGLSNLIRLTNTTIPAYVLLAPILYEKLSPRRVKVAAVLLIAITALSAGFYITAVQTNFQLPYNVLDFSHVNAPLQARDMLIRNATASVPTVVFLSWNWQGAQLYLRDIPGVVMYPTADTTWSALHSNYTEDYFLGLHPSVFYVFSEIALSNWDASKPLPDNVYRMVVYQPIFMIKTYGVLNHLNTTSYPDTQYSIDSVKVLFNDPTGQLLKVQVSWHS